MHRFKTFLFCSIAFLSFFSGSNAYKVGDVIDEYQGVKIYFNGHFKNVAGRHMTKDGYNLGLKWQCVEFVKRFYYNIYGIRMPNSYGHAKEYFDKSLNDSDINYSRGLLQFRNTRYEKPAVNDILIYGATPDNPFGHIGIISKVGEKEIELIQQNVGSKTRQIINLIEYEGIWTVADFGVLGWLRPI